MKPRHLFYSALPTTLITVACSVLAANSASAASQTWDGDSGVDASWATITNWVGGAAPGSITTTSNDVATFNSALFGGNVGGAANPVVVDPNRRIGSILFTTASVGPYVIGATGGNLLQLSAQNAGTNSVSIAADVTTSQTLAGPLDMTQPSSQNNNYAFINNSTTTGANLIISGNIDATNTTRTWGFILDGTNTGNNIISGNINNDVTTASGPNALIKNGIGTWILSGANFFDGAPATTAGFVVNAGTLVLQNNLALGNTTNAKMFVNGGVLELNSSSANGSITLDNALTLTVANGATVRSAGTNTTNSRIAFATGAGVSSTLSTVGAADVFTVGNAANDFSGGAADTVVHIAGPGTVLLSQASNYAGTVSLDAGTLNLGSATALGTQGNVNVAGGANLQTMANSPTLTVLTGSGSVSNGTAGTSTLTANIASLNTFSGQLQDGVAGTLALTKSGGGTLTLSGTSNYTGATTISTGVLNLTGTLGSTAVSGGTSATLSGSGTIAGGVAVDSGVRIAPGDGGNAAIGTLTVGTLDLNSGSQLDFGITNATTLDQVIVTTGSGLMVNGGQLNINGGLSAFTAIGTYPLIAHTGAVIPNLNSLLTVNGLNKSVTRTYTFTDSGGFINLVVANSGVVQTFWNVNADGNWSTNSNWTPATAPNAVQAFVGFGGGGTEITADRIVTVDGTFTAGTLAFDGAANGRSYTLADGGVANIVLDNGAAGSGVTDSSGNHTINSPLTLTSNGATFAVINVADTLTVGGAIGGSGTPLVKAGLGTLVLGGTNTYFNGTEINGGTLAITNAASLGDPANITTINAGTLRAVADIATTTTETYRIGDLGSTIAVAPGVTYTVNGLVIDGAVAGTLNKGDSGTLVLTNTNTYTGGTVINAGTVQINTADSLGAAAGAVTINNATLQATASFTGTRNVSLGNANSAISVDTGFTYTVSGPISGTGTLNKTGGGTLSLGSNANTYTGGTVITSGTLAVNNTSFVNGTVTFMGGTLQNNYGNNNTYFLGNPISVPTGQVGTINMNNRMNIGGAVSGGGTLNVNLNTTATRDDLTNSWTGFTGQVNFAGSGTARLLNNGGTFNVNSFANSSVDVSGGAFLQSVTNSSGNTYLFGSLSGSSATAGFTGGTAGTATLSVGALNASTTFAGQINGNTALTKVGTGTLTLSGINGYTGSTSLQGGALVLADNASLTFRPGAPGVTNSISGTGALPLTLDGDFNLDLTNPAALVNGGSWTLVNVATFPANPFSASFTVTTAGFTEASDVWTKVDGGKTWTFTESTGVLSLSLVGYYVWGGPYAGGQEPSADFDNDGVSNGVEYFMNITTPGFTANPALGGGNTISWPNGGNLVPSDYGTKFVVQTSNDLAVWEDVPEGALASNDAVLSYTLTGTAPRFVRLMVKPTL
ncbi:MAG: autotransporter-associated beta strand repeat-containing protein [Verrucomicrobiota bacterium]